MLATTVLRGFVYLTRRLLRGDPLHTQLAAFCVFRYLSAVLGNADSVFDRINRLDDS